jgi:RNA polymerase sigma factor (TIGR02999 family)
VAGTKSVTSLLEQLRQGNQQVRSELLSMVYPELRRLAQHYMKNEKPGHTLQATAVVHEVYIRMLGSGGVAWQNRAHFLAVAAQQMRHILVDHARARHAEKRGGNLLSMALDDVNAVAYMRDENLLALDEALTRLTALDSTAGRLVEMRFFGGLTERETGEALGMSVSGVKRKWEFARAWLFDQLNTAAPPNC